MGALSSKHLLLYGWSSLEMHFKHKESEVLLHAVIGPHVMLHIAHLHNMAIVMWSQNGSGVS